MASMDKLFSTLIYECKKSIDTASSKISMVPEVNLPFSRAKI